MLSLALTCLPLRGVLATHQPGDVLSMLWSTRRQWCIRKEKSVDLTLGEVVYASELYEVSSLFPLHPLPPCIPWPGRSPDAQLGFGGKVPRLGLGLVC